MSTPKKINMYVHFLYRWLGFIFVTAPLTVFIGSAVLSVYLGI